MGYECKRNAEQNKDARSCFSKSRLTKVNPISIEETQSNPRVKLSPGLF